MSWSGFESSAASIDTQAQGIRNNPYSYGKMGSEANKPNNWESLRKRARALENEIDLKLVSFSKMGTSLTRGSLREDQQPLLGQGQEVEGLQADLEGLLQQLGQVNDDMSNFAGGGGAGQSAAIHHTLQRHTEILQDYRQEFKKTSANISAIVEREDLLTSVHSDLSDFRKNNSKGTKRNQKMDSMQREMDHIRNSEQLIDEQISIALDTRESLVSQREILKAAQKKLNDLTNKFPMINNLVSKINLRKRRDSIILGLVVGLCLTFMLWYIFG